MAAVFDKQGEYIKALEWYQHTLDAWRKTLGKDHPSTLITVHNMGILYFKLGEHNMTRDWLQHALDGWVKTLGKDLLSALDTFNNIAILSCHQWKYKRALD
jgi:tetratricopeptide (TPR) repeat protein